MPLNLPELQKTREQLLTSKLQREYVPKEFDIRQQQLGLQQKQYGLNERQQSLTEAKYTDEQNQAGLDYLLSGATWVDGQQDKPTAWNTYRSYALNRLPANMREQAASQIPEQYDPNFVGMLKGLKEQSLSDIQAKYSSRAIGYGGVPSEVYAIAIGAGLDPARLAPGADPLTPEEQAAYNRSAAGRTSAQRNISAALMSGAVTPEQSNIARQEAVLTGYQARNKELGAASGKAEAELPVNLAQMNSTLKSIDVNKNAIKSILPVINRFNTGVGSKLLADIGFKENQQIKNTIDQIKSSTGLNMLADLKARGITLGQVTEAEHALLQKNIAALEQSNTADEVKRNFEIVLATYDRLQEGLRADYAANVQKSRIDPYANGRSSNAGPDSGAYDRELTDQEKAQTLATNPFVGQPPATLYGIINSTDLSKMNPIQLQQLKEAIQQLKE